ncbi:hypothetical protein C7S20_14690 [Christiangramia fulva]|uniref:Membrane transport protein MMPL domain-containing protein n=1 Tax=Christiangramia fulva TaxID=2126553 RepID=A0A2R3Z862_9FLAO|nr:MMPL family transporter [Christiangramia fulva]AVR46412.1 hypothetical protein C7S20_14690 [Christiangramia fulva]
MHKAFYNIYSFLKKRPYLGLVFVLIYLGFIGFFAWNISLEEDITALVPRGKEQKKLQKILSTTNFSDKIIIDISAQNDQISPDSLVSYADHLTSRIEDELPKYIKDIRGKVPDEDLNAIYTFVYDNLPIFLDNQDYEEMSNRIQPDSIRDYLSRGYRRLMAPTGFFTKNYFFKDPLNFTNLGLEKLRELQTGDDFGIYNNYLISENRDHIILFLDPVYPSSETGKNKILVNKLNQITSELNSEFEGVHSDYFGGVLYSLANAERIKKDIIWTLGIAFILLLALLLFFYRKIYVPLLLFLPSIIGGVSAIAFLSIFKGSVSAISLGIGAVLLGISIDYALHILTHFRNNTDVEKLYKDVSRPILMSSLTTAVAFACLLFVKSEALTDLGIFASISVLLSSLFSLVLIPLLYNPAEENLKKTFLDKIAAKDYSKIKPLFYGLIILFLGSLFFFSNVKFNNDLSSLNYQPKEIKQLEDSISKVAGRSEKTLYLVAYGNSVDDALQENNELYKKLQNFKNEGLIENFSSIGGVILSTNTQNRRIEHWNTFWTDSKRERVKENVLNFSSEFGFKPRSFDCFYDEMKKHFYPIDLDDYQKAGSLYLDDFISEKNGFATVVNTVSLKEENAEKIENVFQNSNGVVAIDRKLMNQSFLGHLRQNFNELIGYSIIAVFLILLLFYGNLELSLLTLLPIAVTWICALGIMSVLNIEFNILNIIISTFIFGLGLDYSIFITNSCLKEYETGEFDLKTYQTSILLSVITTLLGMGALIFAQHPALRSISIVSIIGVIMAVSVSFILQRRIFRAFLLDRAKKGKAPIYLANIPYYFRKDISETEKLYRKKSVLDNYHYKSVEAGARKHFRQNRELFVRISRYIEDGQSIGIINSGQGELALFLHYKFPNSKITGLEIEEEKRQIAANTPASYISDIEFTDEIEKLEGFEVYIVNADYENKSALRELIGRNAKKVIFADTEFPSRWLLDLNFEIIYRQNNILVFQKAD